MGKAKIYYLDAETVDFTPNLRITSFSADTEDLIKDYLKWVNQHHIDFEHTSYAHIRVAKTDRLVAWLEQADDFMSVIEHPVEYSSLKDWFEFLVWYVRDRKDLH